MVDAGIGGIVTKSAAPNPSGNPFRSVVQPHAWFASGDRQLSLLEACELIRAAKQELPVPIIANFDAGSAAPEDWARSAVALAKAGADALELHLSPAVPDTRSSPWALHAKAPPLSEGRVALGCLPDVTAGVVAAVRQAIDIPLLAKLTPNAPDLIAVALACQASGIDGLSATNVLQAMAPLDVERLGRPSFPLFDSAGFGNVMGPALAPIARRYTAEVVRATGAPVSSAGGIMSAEDVIERLLLGAGTVQLCSALYYSGLGVIHEMLEGLAAFLDRHELPSVSALQGLAQPHLMAASRVQHVPGVAVLRTADHCGGCEAPCVSRSIASCRAIHYEGAWPVIDANLCTGCALCCWACPFDSITLEPAQRTQPTGG